MTNAALAAANPVQLNGLWSYDQAGSSGHRITNIPLPGAGTKGNTVPRRRTGHRLFTLPTLGLGQSKSQPNAKLQSCRCHADVVSQIVIVPIDDTGV